MQLPVVVVVEDAVQLGASQDVAGEQQEQGQTVEDEDGAAALVTLRHEHQHHQQKARHAKLDAVDDALGDGNGLQLEQLVHVGRHSGEAIGCGDDEGLRVRVEGVVTRPTSRIHRACRRAAWVCGGEGELAGEEEVRASGRGVCDRR